MDISLEEKIINFLNSGDYPIKDSQDFIEDLYWADRDLLEEDYPNDIDNIFKYLRRDDFSNEEISKILKLYNNPHGAYVSDFSRIILDLYQKDRRRFIKALNKEKDEISNLVYLFRNEGVEVDEDLELLNILEEDGLSEEERDTGESFIKTYEKVCNT